MIHRRRQEGRVYGIKPCYLYKIDGPESCDRTLQCVSHVRPKKKKKKVPTRRLTTRTPVHTRRRQVGGICDQVVSAQEVAQWIAHGGATIRRHARSPLGQFAPSTQRARAVANNGVARLFWGDSGPCVAPLLLSPPPCRWLSIVVRSAVAARRRHVFVERNKVARHGLPAPN